MKELFRLIPQVSSILESDDFKKEYGHFDQRITSSLIREALDSVREKITSGEALDEPQVKKLVESTLKKKLFPLIGRSLIRVINATGIVLHTNLGRAPMLPNPYLASLLEGYCNLEYDLAEGKRGKRGIHVKSVIKMLLGAESTVVVNNNAAAILLLLRTHAEGKEVIVSRGELIELGGSFRLPEVMTASGAMLHEVGTTNRTHLKDYAGAINEKTGLILKVHPSNYAIRGFTSSPSTAELSALAKEKDVPFVYDVGSGLLRKIDHPNFREEPDCLSALNDGADAILFSGDKILGGTQAGFIVGSEKIAGACGKIPLMRSLRLAKAHMCILEEALRTWLLPGREVMKLNPVMRMISMMPEELEARANALSEGINKVNPAIKSFVKKVEGYMGGGSLPDINFDSYAVAIKPKETPQLLLQKLRNFETPIVARIEDDLVLFDMRTILDGEGEKITRALAQ